MVFSREHGGKLTPRVRLSWKVSAFLVVLVLFVVPHDPSSRVRHGSQAFRTPIPMGRFPQHAATMQNTIRKQSLAYPLRKRFLLERRKLRISISIAQRVLQASSAWIESHGRLLGVQLLGERAASASAALRVASPTADDAEWESLAANSAANGTYVITSVDELRRVHGSRRSWFGDLNAAETRSLYHSLLPTALIEEANMPLAERARLAVQARHAARLYARERAMLPVTVPCQLFDGFRQLLENGRFQPDGMSEEQVFSKYAQRHGLPPNWGEEMSSLEAEQYSEFFMEILFKSCTTNSQVDEFADSVARGDYNVMEQMMLAAEGVCGLR